ncbi:hypothetical protein BASA81_000817 [Batrachochytrium salamandrivorans]|nr:hypothetical protein BASA81_000817 [Batrachochytrium salamandrivorans]
MLFRQVIDLPEHSPEVLCVKAEGVAKGSMVLLHGFPDTNWGWRKLLIPLSKLGFDVYAPTQRGYGPTDKLRLTKVSDFAMEKICQDVAWLLDFFLIDRAIVVGHDWGGTVAWQFAAHYPTRVQSVCVFCTPFTMPNPQSNPWEKMQRTGMQGRFAYQMVFQSDYAVELLERNLDQTLRVMMRGPVESEDELSKEDLDFLMAVRLGQPVPELPATTTLPHPLLTQTEVLRYKMQFAQSGFLNPKLPMYWEHRIGCYRNNPNVVLN